MENKQIITNKGGMGQAGQAGQAGQRPLAVNEQDRKMGREEQIHFVAAIMRLLLFFKK